MKIYQVCIPHTKRNYFDYQANQVDIAIGVRVWVPFGSKKRLGLIIGISTTSLYSESIKTIESQIDEQPIFSATMLNLCHWVSAYYQAPLSEVIPLALPKKYRLGKEITLPSQDFYQLAIPAEQAKQCVSTRAHKQQSLIDFLQQQSDLVSKPTLIEKGFTLSQLNALLAAQIVSVIPQLTLPTQAKQETKPALALNDEQLLALTTCAEQLTSYQCFLLHGVTGSGKTEVYLQLITQVLKQGRQVLVLVPEIGLTPQLLARFSERFREPLAVIHSNLNETERQVAWQLAHDNLAKLIIGTRTAVFTPMPALGLIIIDEEHDSSLKQMDGVRYSARDTALMRAYLADIPIVLGSATPSLESLHNCTQQKYKQLRLMQKAIAQTPLEYKLIDIRNSHLQHGLAPQTLQTINEHLLKKNQVLVFINRRGFAPVLLCHHCGWMADCLACDSHLTLHRQSGQLICHHCGSKRAIPSQCKSCHNKELLPVGTGTQRVHEFLAQQFPQVGLVRIDRDEMRKKNTFDKQLKRINDEEIQLIVGTQMLAKGHHFPRLTLVVILEADAGFYNQDFRALERLGQLLTQVAGRAGRAEFAGQVLIQTHLPQHPMLNLLIKEGYDAFATNLLISRQQANLPPYYYLAVLRAQDKVPAKVLRFLHRCKEQLISLGIEVLGPAPAPLARKALQHRMQLLIKSPSRKLLQTALTQFRDWLTINKLTNHVRWNIDVDPIDLS